MGYLTFFRESKQLAENLFVIILFLLAVFLISSIRIISGFFTADAYATLDMAYGVFAIIFVSGIGQLLMNRTGRDLFCDVFCSREF